MLNRKPIPSYGVILFTLVDNVPYYLIAQRRDTIAYVECFKHKYKVNDYHALCKRMTIEERDRLMRHIDDFDSLWMDYTLNPNFKHTANYTKAKHHFETNKHLLREAILNTTSTKVEPERVFPRGRKNSKETVEECMMREFEEETGMRADAIREYTPDRITETYIGTNGRTYSTTYCVCETFGKLRINHIRSCSTIEGREYIICKEIKDLMWATLEEIEQGELLNEMRIKLLHKVDELITQTKNFN